MANSNTNTKSFAYNILSPSASVDANYGPWSSPQEYETWLNGTVLPGTLIAIHNQTTGEVTLKMN